MKERLGPLQLGSLTLPNRIIYSPLAGCSDYPFRQIAARYRPGLMFCEMVKMEPLVRNHPGTFAMLDYSPEMRPIGGQICGSNLTIAGESAKIIEDLGFDVVDLNCGCPVDKVTKDGSGSGMLKTPEMIGDILAEMVNAVDIPVTVKIRAGWSDESINAPEITKIAEEAGAVAISVHGRTRQQAYRGPAQWDYIKQCKEAATSILVFGNGDVFSGEAAEEMFQTTGCDAVLASRGTMGRPWIVEDILRHLAGEEPLDRSPEFCRQALLDHFTYVLNYHPEKRVLLDMRRVGCWYLKKSSGTRKFRNAICRATDLDEIRSLIEDFDFEGDHAPQELSEAPCCS